MRKQRGVLDRRVLLASLGAAAFGLTGCPLTIPDVTSLSSSTPEGDEQGSASSVPDVETLLARISTTLEIERDTRGLSTMVNGAWQIFHGILAFGETFEIDTADGRVRAIEYFANGGTCAGFRPRPGDEFPREKPNRPTD